jgi:hypothetical protein
MSELLFFSRTRKLPTEEATLEAASNSADRSQEPSKTPAKPVNMFDYALRAGSQEMQDEAARVRFGFETPVEMPAHKLTLPADLPNPGAHAAVLERQGRRDTALQLAARARTPLAKTFAVNALLKAA